MPPLIRPAFFLFVCLQVGLVLSQRANADAFVRTNAMNSTTILELFIEDGSIRAELEIGLSDVRAFKNLLPDELYEKLGESPVPLADRLVEFFSRDFVIQTENGDPLPGMVKEPERSGADKAR